MIGVRNMDHVIIKANNIQEGWFKAIKSCVEVGHTYTIDKGEYEGQKRKEFDMVTLHIENPGLRPLACQSQFITPTTDEKIEKYFQEYLMNPEFASEEEAKNNRYKYASWIAPNWMKACDLLTHGMGGCNQATISLGPDLNSKSVKIQQVAGDEQLTMDYELEEIDKHPPCLRIIDMRVRYGKLHFIIYFRSWDLIAGYPENMGGIQLLKEWCLNYINLILQERGDNELEDGTIIACSKGMHIYQHFWPIVKEYVGPHSILDSNPKDTGIWIIK